MARRIRQAEQIAREAVAGIPEAADILLRRPDRAERTRAGAVDRLEEAVKVVTKGDLRLDLELASEVLGDERVAALRERLANRLAREGNVYELSFALSRNPDPNLRDGRGRTALHVAAASGRVSLMKQLLSLGADPAAADQCAMAAEV